MLHPTITHSKQSVQSGASFAGMYLADELEPLCSAPESSSQKVLKVREIKCR